MFMVSGEHDRGEITSISEPYKVYSFFFFIVVCFVTRLGTEPIRAKSHVLADWANSCAQTNRLTALTDGNEQRNVSCDHNYTQSIVPSGDRWKLIVYAAVLFSLFSSFMSMIVRML